MANIDHKEGAYSIQAHASTAFTFWWGSGSKDPNEYFVVSISPKFDPQNPAMQPLLEQSRSRYWDARPGMGDVLILTLHNPTPFAVNFMANHVRIYN
jgi:hypothetical protein